MKRFLAAFFLYSILTITSASSCGENFDFGHASSCYKYATHKMVTLREAETYCEEVVGGRLARLDSSGKTNAIVAFFRSRFEEEKAEGGVPTAWIEGTWIPGTRSLRFRNGFVDPRPKWMPPSRNVEKRTSIRWPQPNFLGWEARCVVVSLWEPLKTNPRRPEVAGVYNVPCSGVLYTHPLCEVTK